MESAKFLFPFRYFLFIQILDYFDVYVKEIEGTFCRIFFFLRRRCALQAIFKAVWKIRVLT